MPCKLTSIRFVVAGFQWGGGGNLAQDMKSCVNELKTNACWLTGKSVQTLQSHLPKCLGYSPLLCVCTYTCRRMCVLFSHSHFSQAILIDKYVYVATDNIHVCRLIPRMSNKERNGSCVVLP